MLEFMLCFLSEFAVGFMSGFFFFLERDAETKDEARFYPLGVSLCMGSLQLEKGINHTFQKCKCSVSFTYINNLHNILLKGIF